MNMRTKVLGFMWAIIGDYHVAEDAFQEVSIVVLGKYHKYREGTNFEAWVMDVARRTALYHRRKMLRGQVDIPEQFIERLQSAFTIMENDEELQSRREALRECIEKLHPEERRLIELRYLKQQALKQIAERFGAAVTVDGIRSRIRRIRQFLSRCVAITLGGRRLPA
jgi:RNA polymerase sigma-70 factor